VQCLYIKILKDWKDMVTHAKFAKH